MKINNYKVQLVLTLLCLMTAMTVNAKPITLEQARQKALLFKTQKGDIRPIKAVVNKKRLAPRRAGSTTSYDPYYVFEHDNNEGFVIVSGDDQTIDVLGYTDKGTFDYEQLPPALQDMLNGYARQIEKIQAGAPVLKAPATHPKVETLMTTKWSQGSPYNDACPLDGGKRSVTGCVATAMAQILYYNRDKSVTETQAAIPAYNTWTKNIHVDGIPSGSAIDWNNMKDTYGSATDIQKKAVADLMHYCGVSVQMDYTNSSSGAQSSAVVSAIKNYFGYSADAYLWDYTNDTEADAVMYAEMEAGRAVYVSGANASVGHAFVCDGYENKRYHINWGWGGTSDGLYYLSNLTPGDGQGIGGSDDGYNYYKDFLIHMEPKDYQNMAMKFEDAEVGRICMANWDADKDGKLTYGEVALVTSLGEAFKGNTNIKRFNELYYFTSLNTLTDDAFNGCTNLASIRLPKALKHIGARSFKDCATLRQINLPTGIQSLGADAFNGCMMMNAIEIPSAITAIEDGTFKGCAQITSVELPIGVKKIGNEAFAGCTHLSTFTIRTFHPKDISLGTDIFANDNLTDATLNVMQGTKSYFSTTTQWKDFGNIHEMRERSGGQFAELESGQTYYLYNVGTGKYLTKGEAWGTQAIVGDSPMRFQMCLPTLTPEGIYFLTSPDTGKEGYFLFRTTTDSNVGNGVLAAFVDGTLALNNDNTLASTGNERGFWRIEPVGEKIYTIQIPATDANYQEGKYWGVQTDHASNAAQPTYGVYGDVDYATNPYNCQWQLVIYDKAKEENYKQAEILANLISTAKKEQKKYTEEQAVYDNLESTTEQLKAAQSSLRKKLGLLDFADDVARDRCILYFDSDGDGELSYKEVSELTDLGWLFGFASFTDLISFDELQYFTNISALTGSLFNGCTNLKSVILPKKLEKIYYRVFYNCKSLTSICIPERVNNIGENCFYGCSALREVTVENPDPSSISLGTNPFGGVPLSQCTLYVPFGSKEAYSKANIWKNFGTIVEVRSSSVAPRFSPITTNKTGYIYNIGTRKMVALGEAYGTQSVVANSGRLYQWKATGSNYYLYDVKSEKVVFRTSTDSKVGDGVKACFGDGNLSPKAYWKVDSVGENIYSLQLPTSDADYIEGEYLGINENHASEYANGDYTYGLYWDIEGVTPYSQWAFITEDDMKAAEESEDIIAKLKNMLASAKSQSIDVSTEQAVYDNAESTIIDLRAALISVREKMGLITFSDTNVETLCLANWDTNLDGDLSLEEAAAVTDIAETFRGITNIKYFEELKYFTSLNEIPDNAFRTASALQTIYLPKSVKSIGTYAFTACSVLRNLVILNDEDFIPFNTAGLTSQCTVFLPKNTLASYEADETWATRVKSLTEYTGKPVVTAEATRIYGRSAANITSIILGAPVDGEPEMHCDLISVATTPAGTYPIEVSTGSIVTKGVELRNGVFTVTKAPLTITAKSYTREQGQPNPTFELTYKTFRNKETAEVFTKQPVITCDATPESPVGDYDIIVSGAEAQNYEFTYVNGKLTITASTGIAEVSNSTSHPSPLYDMQGRKVKTPQRGIYINNKKKVIIRK